LVSNFLLLLVSFLFFIFSCMGYLLVPLGLRNSCPWHGTCCASHDSPLCWWVPTLLWQYVLILICVRNVSSKRYCSSCLQLYRLHGSELDLVTFFHLKFHLFYLVFKSLVSCSNFTYFTYTVVFKFHWFSLVNYFI